MLFDSVDVVEDRLGMVCLLSEIVEVVESVLLSGIDRDDRAVDIAERRSQRGARWNNFFIKCKQFFRTFFDHLWHVYYRDTMIP